MSVHVGTSGWSYDHWDGVLYPPGCRAADRLEHYVREFTTVELNASVYRWPRPDSFARWRDRTPDGFLLVQLAASQPRDDARLDHFLTSLPAWLRVSVELRHPSWDDDEVYAILEGHGAAYCVVSGAGLPCVLRATADIVYVRLHGPDNTTLYGGCYPDEDLRWWAARIHEWESGGRDVFVYFNNDGGGNAVRNARTLRAMLGR